tara:strand:+ start:447 stop:668 length:222 start_codon:yes stop_codon:yes gene_type:complete
MAKYTDEFILRVRRKAKEMTANEVAEEEQMTIGKINYIIYKAELKNNQTNKGKKQNPVAEKKKSKTFLEWLLG